jgi:dihydrofolate reductase
MARLRVHNYSISLDGYGAGPGQSVSAPLGEGGTALHDWVFLTRSGRQMILGQPGGAEGVDDDFVAAGVEGIGTTIMGRNMFGPVRGPWAGADEWRGWWGDEPPFHHPVFVLTHHARDPLTMGATTFHFTDAPIESVLAQAFEAAGGLDVRLGGGAQTVQQFLRAGLIDDLHFAIAPVLLGQGERLFDHLGDGPVGYECAEVVPSPEVTHVRLVRRAS